MKVPKEREVTSSVRRVEKRPQSRETLEKDYNIESILGLVLLIRDADDLESNEKAVLGQLAIAVGGPGVDYDPALTFIGHDAIAHGAAISVSHVKRGYTGLKKKHILERSKVSMTRWHTRVDWSRLREYSYRWRDMLAREAAGGVCDQKPAEMTRPLATIPGPLSEIHHDLSGLEHEPPTVPDAEQDEEETIDGDEPMEEAAEHRTLAILHREAVFIDTLLGSAFRRGIAFTDSYPLGEDGEQLLMQMAVEWGFDVEQGDEGIRIALPLHEYAALRLTQASGKQVESANCEKLTNKHSSDHYSVVEHGLATESWATLIREADSPIGMLMKCFANIQDNWIANGSPVLQPPIEDLLAEGQNRQLPDLRTVSLEERRNLFIEHKRVTGYNFPPQDGFECDEYWKAEWVEFTKVCSALEHATGQDDDEWANTIEKQLAAAAIAGDMLTLNDLDSTENIKEVPVHEPMRPPSRPRLVFHEDPEQAIA